VTGVQTCALPISWDQDDHGVGNADNHAGDSKIYDHLPSSITQDLMTINAATTRFEASFIELQTASDEAGKISNDGSNSFLLIKNFTLSQIDKDSPVDMSGGDPDLDLDVIDEIAYNDDGDEFVFDEANEFDFSPGFNPGALVRCANITDSVVDHSIDVHPGTQMGQVEPYRDAYSEWWGGEVDDNPDNSHTDTFLTENQNYGAGTYTTMPNTFTPMQDLTNVVLTPGYENHTFSMTRLQIEASCSAKSTRGDVNNDGSVDALDILEEFKNGGNNQTIARILTNMGR